MTLALLNNVDHHDIRVTDPRNWAGAARVNQVLVFAGEIEELQRHYPIVLRKSVDGPLRPVAILGLGRDENLFTDDAGKWDASVQIPAALQRGPFSIAGGDGEDDNTAPRILIDTDHPSTSRTEGEALFLPKGGNSPFLDRMVGNLATIFDGQAQADAMVAALKAADLLKPANLQIRTGPDALYAISDAVIVDRDRVGELAGEQLLALAANGYLSHAIHFASSLGNFARLAERKACRERQTRA